MYNKVELCGVNTGQLPVMTEAGKRQADIAYKNHGLMFSFGWRASERPEPRLMDARLL